MFFEELETDRKIPRRLGTHMSGAQPVWKARFVPQANPRTLRLKKYGITHASQHE
jgi:hypothetical protein